MLIKLSTSTPSMNDKYYVMYCKFVANNHMCANKGGQ